MDTEYLIWSNEHRAWWRPRAQGYTIDLKRAGRYTREDATRHCRGRDQNPGKPFPEIPVREDDILRIIWTPEHD